MCYWSLGGLWLSSLHQNQHQAETQHEEEEDEGVRWGGELPAEAEVPGVGGQRLGLDVVLHGLPQVVLLGAEAQLSAGLVDLEGVAHSDVPHLASQEIYGSGLAEGYLGATSRAENID